MTTIGTPLTARGSDVESARVKARSAAAAVRVAAG